MNNYPPDPYLSTQPTQPSSPPPGNYQNPQPVTPKKRRRGLWTGAIVVLLLLLAGAGAYYYLVIRSTPQKTFQAYCNAVTKDDGLALYNLYTSEQQAKVSEQTVQRELQLISAAAGGFQSCTVDNGSIQQSGSVATGTVELLSNRNRTFNDTVDLVEENGQWKVEHSINIP